MQKQFNAVLLVLLLVVLAVSPRTASAQGLIIKGEVRDSLGESPVLFANVIVKGTTEGTVTTETGLFELHTSKSNPVLVISSLGYVTKEISYSDIKNSIIFLKPKTNQLQEVVISGDKTKALQDDNNYYFMDFDFYDDYIVALTALGNKKYLQLLDAAGNTISSLKVNSKSEKLFKDCIGKIHLLTPDSSYQVYYDYVKLQLLTSYSIDMFGKLLVPCQCELRDVYYFRQYTYRGLKCNYFCAKASEPGKLYPFRIVADSARIQDFNAQYDLHYFLEIRRKTRGEMYGEPISSIKEHMDLYREQLPMDWEGMQWLRPVESELHRIGNAAYLFNFTDSVIEKYYDRDSLMEKIPFKLHGDKSSIHHVITDEPAGAAYLAFEKNDITSIRRISLSNEKEEGSYELSRYPFPLKLKVRNGIAYFIYKEKGTDKPAKICRMVLQ